MQKCIVIFCIVVTSCESEDVASFPLSLMSLQKIVRLLQVTPLGRVPIAEDIIIRHYHTNITSPTSLYIGKIEELLKDPKFDVKRPTVLYAHGYLEKGTDESVQTVMSAYIRRGGYNILFLDWANIAYGIYLVDAIILPTAAEYVGKGFLKLLNQGLSIDGLHFVGHSLGSHFVAYIARNLAKSGYKLPRLTGLDTANPIFLAHPTNASDAIFVDVIHTDAGYFGTPTSTGHVDFWPNGGQGIQPGCISATIPLTTEDFCSHSRSWVFWAESLNSDSFLARKCENYDSFLKDECQEEPTALMGIRATPDLRGDFYLRTAAKSPYGLGTKGAN